MPFRVQFVNLFRKSKVDVSMSKSLMRSTAVVSSMTFISRIFGFLRDMVCAHIFGAGSGFDAFIVAFRIPNFMRRLFAEGAFTQAFVPVLTEYREQRPKEARELIARASGMLGLALLIVTIAAQLITPLIIMVFAPGFVEDPARFTLASEMLRITFPYLFFISLTAFGSAVLNSYGSFAIPAFTPTFLNLVMIAAAVWLSPYFSQPIIGLAWGVFFAGLVQLLFQLPFLKRLNLLPRPKLHWGDSGVRRILTLMVPALFGVSIAQIGLLVDTLFASFLPVGSVSWLYFSERLTEFPLGVFGVALATVVLPHLSRQYAAKSPEDFSVGLDWALRCVLIIGVPAGVGLVLLAGPLLATLFQSQAFGPHDVVMAQRSLIALSIGVPAFMLVKVLASGFYSRQNIRTPVRIAAIALAANVILNFSLITSLAHAGLALSTSLASFLNAGLLCWGLVRKNAYLPRPGWLRYGAQLLFANLAMGISLWYTTGPLSVWLEAHWYERVAHLLLCLVVAVSVYFFCLGVSGIRLKNFRVAIRV
jgi:putative peptidoglycan lipid II flippase